MKKIVRFIMLFLLTLGGISTAIAGDHPQAHFGVYGIQHQPNIAGYQQYVGQTVKYIPFSYKGISEVGNYKDKKYFLEKLGGRFDTEYIITKISGKDKQMTFELKEKDGKKKIKMVVNNQDEYYSHDK